MAAFQYVALDARGKEVKGVLEGDNAKHIRQQLRDKSLTPLSVNQAKESVFSGSLFQSKGPSISVKDLALFTRQLATLIAAGLPIEECLRAVAEQTEKQKIKSMVLAIRGKVLEGHSLANALNEYPRAFPHLYRATVAAGEHAGHLDLVLERLADYSEQTHESNSKVKMAALYPAILFVVTMAIVVGLLHYVVPKIVGIFSNNNQELPPITQMVIATNEFISSYGLFVILLLIAGGFAFSRALEVPDFRYRWHSLVLRMPLFGRFARDLNTARFASTLAILHSSSVPLVEAMRIASDVITNMVVKSRLKTAAEEVSKGGSLYRALDETRQFPPIMLHMVASGEQSGELEAMLERTANNQQKDLENTLTTLVKALEPLMLLVMGGIVMVIVVAMMLPIFTMNQMVG